MKAFNTIVKIVVALAAVAGAVYVAATYGDKIVAWAKKILASLPCKCSCDGECECGGECTCECSDAPVAEEAVEEIPAEEPAAEEAPVDEPVADETAVMADEADFE